MLTHAVPCQALRFEQTLAFHCAPALAGIKPADLVSIPGDREEIVPLLRQYGAQLRPAGIRLRLLHSCPGRCLLLVYRPRRLEEQLSREEVRALLRRDGYPVEEGYGAMLRHLSARLAGSEGFPHEIGLFLGYPAEDVEGFRLHGGQDFKYSGLWKVYSDVDRARQCFHRYRCCRRALCRRVQAGFRLSQLFQAA